MSSFTREHLNALMAAAVSIPPQPVGLVCHPGLKHRLEGEQRASLAEIPEPWSGYPGIPIYEDARQEAEILAFYDTTLLRLYLARHESNEAMLAWVKAYVESQTQTQPTNLQ